MLPSTQTHSNSDEDIRKSKKQCGCKKKHYLLISSEFPEGARHGTCLSSPVRVHVVHHHIRTSEYRCVAYHRQSTLRFILAPSSENEGKQNQISTLKRMHNPSNQKTPSARVPTSGTGFEDSLRNLPNGPWHQSNSTDLHHADRSDLTEILNQYASGHLQIRHTICDTPFVKNVFSLKKYKFSPSCIALKCASPAETGLRNSARTCTLPQALMCSSAPLASSQSHFLDQLHSMWQES